MGEKYFVIYTFVRQLEGDVCLTSESFVDEAAFYEQYAHTCKVLELIPESEFTAENVGAKIMKNKFPTIEEIKENKKIVTEPPEFVQQERAMLEKNLCNVLEH